MKLSKRINQINESITLKLNAKAVELKKSGKTIYNLTAGQLPFRPHEKLVEGIIAETKFLKSFQYAPVTGVAELRELALGNFMKARKLDESVKDQLSCIVSNGAKHSLTNILAALVDKGDEVIVIAPYWLSYPELIKLWGGVPVEVIAERYNGFIPLMEELESKITSKTKAIIINSPNNPTGIYYSESWMRDFAQMIKKYPDVTIVSDEIYYDLAYFDPTPTYHYQVDPELLSRTVILDGISKNLACTGLRIGYTFAPVSLVPYLSRLQGQTTSSANSLVQNALVGMDRQTIKEFLTPIKALLRKNAEILRDLMHEYDLGEAFYQVNGAFYFVLDLAKTPYFNGVDSKTVDHSISICSEILDETGVALVPLSDFGVANAARISLVLSERDIEKALRLVFTFLTKKV